MKTKRSPVWRQNFMIMAGILFIAIPVLVSNWKSLDKPLHQRMEAEAARPTGNLEGDQRGMFSSTDKGLMWDEEELVFYVHGVASWRWDGTRWSPIQGDWRWVRE